MVVENKIEIRTLLMFYEKRIFLSHKGPIEQFKILLFKSNLNKGGRASVFLCLTLRYYFEPKITYLYLTQSNKQNKKRKIPPPNQHNF